MPISGTGKVSTTALSSLGKNRFFFSFFSWGTNTNNIPRVLDHPCGSLLTQDILVFKYSSEANSLGKSHFGKETTDL